MLQQLLVTTILLIFYSVSARRVESAMSAEGRMSGNFRDSFYEWLSERYSDADDTLHRKSVCVEDTLILLESFIEEEIEDSFDLTSKNGGSHLRDLFEKILLLYEKSLSGHNFATITLQQLQDKIVNEPCYFFNWLKKSESRIMIMKEVQEHLNLRYNMNEDFSDSIFINPKSLPTSSDIDPLIFFDLPLSLQRAVSAMKTASITSFISKTWFILPHHSHVQLPDSEDWQHLQQDIFSILSQSIDFVSEEVRNAPRAVVLQNITNELLSLLHSIWQVNESHDNNSTGLFISLVGVPSLQVNNPSPRTINVD